MPMFLQFTVWYAKSPHIWRPGAARAPAPRRIYSAPAKTHAMGLVRALIGGAAFVVVGLAAIVVGAFMLRGNLHMWDRRDRTDSEK